MDKTILNILNDDVVLLDKPEDFLKPAADDVKSDVIDSNTIKETEFVNPTESKDLILNKEEYSKLLRAKLYPVNQGLPVSPDSNEERIQKNKEVPKTSLAFLKEKLQKILKELEELENDEKIIEEESTGLATSTDGIAQYKEKIGKFSMFKRK